ncbi:hypothetical protein BELL_0051g00150 [Botrytis elliptica]|uniref:Uncharacterized protein n=1 Tax=Botrytis elliptica TaxID=278938 RepID=A0A4Z1KCF7_9HELO|nr:hypothetical protein BELL_0051g00150 [Botrytis elliptica]
MNPGSQYINTINQTNIHTNHHDKTNRHTPQTTYQYSSCLHALAALMLPVKVAQAPAAAAKTRYANFFLAAGQAPGINSTTVALMASSLDLSSHNLISIHLVVPSYHQPSRPRQR